MAKVFGLAATNLRGSAGKLTFKMVNGTNVMTEKVASVKNPRSSAQQKQRMTMRTVINAYSVLKEICDHSFEGVTTGAPSMAKFMKYNLNMMKGRIYSYSEYATKAFAPNPFIVSVGSLTPITLKEVKSGIYFPDYTTSPTTITPQVICDALGCEVGDQITLMAVRKNGTETTVGQFEGQLELCRIIFDPEKADTAITVGTDLFSAGVLTDESSKGNFTVDVDTVNILIASLSINGTNVDDDIMAACAIVSRKSGSTWLRSSQSLVLSNSYNTLSQYRVNAVLDTYGVETSLYLNNAD